MAVQSPEKNISIEELICVFFFFLATTCRLPYLVPYLVIYILIPILSVTSNINYTLPDKHCLSHACAFIRS